MQWNGKEYLYKGVDMNCPKCNEPLSILIWSNGKNYICYKCGYEKSEYTGSDRLNNPY